MEIADAVKSIPDEQRQLRDQAEQLLALGAARGRSLVERHHAFVKLRGVSNWDVARKPAHQGLVLATIAQTWWNRREEVAPARNSYASYRVIRYERRYVLPGGKGFGPMRTTYERVIEATEDGLSEFRTMAAFHWSSGPDPAYSLMTDGQLGIENSRADQIDGNPGTRMDIVVKFAPMKAGDMRTISILREQQLELGDIGEPGDDTLLYVAPDFQVDELAISVRFGEGLAARTVETFANARINDLRALAVRSGTLRVVDGVAAQTWQKPLIGRASGLRILW
ncbi:hypothetical protein GCM10009819_00380 [Agromyces tropicus]|uniref:Uncharacterized protein n=1 Tax=Agromyces tropicus TaxID=555371 RepID=A0ABN2TVZ1_9MICO